MLPFDVFCPDVARRELRSVTLQPTAVPPSSTIPPDTYAFIELYCEEKGCDCRRVLLDVMSRARQRPVARISHSFEPPKRDFLAEFGQTFLDPLGINEPYAPELLDLFKEVVLDDVYAERLQRHYRLFKECLKTHDVIPGAFPGTVTIVPLRSARSIGPNQPCSCGSGRKYKKCCARI